MLSKAPVKVTPADNLDVKRADEFYGAAAAVIGGLKSPQEALDAAQERVVVACPRADWSQASSTRSRVVDR